jgi:hypothetical protein
VWSSLPHKRRSEKKCNHSATPPTLLPGPMLGRHRLPTKGRLHIPSGFCAQSKPQSRQALYCWMVHSAPPRRARAAVGRRHPDPHTFACLLHSAVGSVLHGWPGWITRPTMSTNATLSQVDGPIVRPTPGTAVVELAHRSPDTARCIAIP